jgi:hypothetical protein
MHKYAYEELSALLKALTGVVSGMSDALGAMKFQLQHLDAQVQGQGTKLAELQVQLAKMSVNTIIDDKLTDIYENTTTIISNLAAIKPTPAPVPQPEPQVTITLPMSKAVAMMAPTPMAPSGGWIDPAFADDVENAQDEAKLAINPADPTVLTHSEKAHAKVGHKIPAIKELRARTGLGLKEAKDTIEGWLIKKNLIDPHTLMYFDKSLGH